MRVHFQGCYWQQCQPHPTEIPSSISLHGWDITGPEHTQVQYLAQWAMDLLSHCIVSPQLWKDISCSQTGPLALGQCHHLIYVAWSSIPMAGSLSSIAVYLHPSILLLSEPTTHRQSIPLADPHEAWLSSMDLTTSAWPAAPITVEQMWRMWWKRERIRTLKETRCHLETIEVPLVEICIQGDDSVQFNMILPSDSLFSSLKWLWSYYWKENIQDHYSRRPHHIFQLQSFQLTYYHISHPSKEYTLAEPNILCFIGVQVHSFTFCNPHFYKKTSHAVNGPSEVSTQK